MNLIDIETFIKVAESKSILTAAQKMFISQSTVSSRIINLETELGIRLFDRTRGRRDLSLTTKGQEFMKFAVDMIRVQHAIQDWVNTPTQEHLRVGSIENLNNTLFPNLYMDILKNGRLGIEVSTIYNSRLTEMLEENIIDIALTTCPYSSQNVFSREVFREDMVVVGNHSISTMVDIRTLPPEKEVFFDWGGEYTEWHDLWFRNTQAKLFNADTMNLLFEALKIEGSWAIVPISVVLYYSKEYALKISKLSTPPPPRVCYLLARRDMRPSTVKAMETFLEHTFQFLKTNEHLQSNIIE